MRTTILSNSTLSWALPCKLAAPDLTLSKYCRLASSVSMPTKVLHTQVQVLTLLLPEHECHSTLQHLWKHPHPCSESQQFGSPILMISRAYCGPDGFEVLESGCQCSSTLRFYTWHVPSPLPWAVHHSCGACSFQMTSQRGTRPPLESSTPPVVDSIFMSTLWVRMCFEDTKQGSGALSPCALSLSMGGVLCQGTLGFCSTCTLLVLWQYF